MADNAAQKESHRARNLKWDRENMRTLSCRVRTEQAEVFKQYCTAHGTTAGELLKKYVGVSPVDYIRQTRLRKAAMLLEQKKFSVSEVMYMVGFSSSSYFSKCFSAMFGCTPGQYGN